MNKYTSLTIIFSCCLEPTPILNSYEVQSGSVPKGVSIETLKPQRLKFSIYSSLNRSLCVLKKFKSFMAHFIAYYLNQINI